MVTLMNDKALLALGMTCLMCLSTEAVGKEYHSGEKPVRLTCIDDTRWVNGSRLELWGSAEKQEGWIRVEGGKKTAHCSVLRQDRPVSHL